MESMEQPHQITPHNHHPHEMCRQGAILLGAHHSSVVVPDVLDAILGPLKWLAAVVGSPEEAW